MDNAILTVLQQHYIIITICSIVLFYVARTAYSVFLGPLSKFPGSKLAAATLWYEFYYDVILKGRFTFKIIEWHAKYGKEPLPQFNPLFTNVPNQVQ